VGRRGGFKGFHRQAGSVGARARLRRCGCRAGQAGEGRRRIGRAQTGDGGAAGDAAAGVTASAAGEVGCHNEHGRRSELRGGGWGVGGSQAVRARGCICKTVALPASQLAAHRNLHYTGCACRHRSCIGQVHCLPSGSDSNSVVREATLLTRPCATNNNNNYFYF
jgi:hypothetical protein